MNKHTKQILTVVLIGVGVYVVYAIASKFFKLLKDGTHTISSAISAAISAPFDSLGKAADAVSNLALGPDSGNADTNAVQNQLDTLNNGSSGWNFSNFGQS